MPSRRLPVSVVIPTYRRQLVLVETIDHLLAAEPAPDEVLVVDQSPDHDVEVTRRLKTWADDGSIRWLTLPAPSIPRAMNTGLVEAGREIVLFVDDDVVPVPSFVGEHVAAHRAERADLVVGRVIQPWGPAALDRTWFESPESSTPGYHWVEEFMGGNFSVKRSRALALGGFDENFVGAAYRFEAEFASRLRAAGGRLLFAPRAEVRHLQEAQGGTRAHGSHLRTVRPHHSVGEYYYLLRGAAVDRRLRRLLWRPLRAVRTRFHLRRPWRIPLSLWAEAAGFAWALALWMRGPRHLDLPVASEESK